MMSVELSVQKALRARLVSDAGVSALVPAAHILDWQTDDAPSPCVIMGEDQLLEGDDIERRQWRVYSTLHVWQREQSFQGVKAIGTAIRAAVRMSRLVLGSGLHCIDCRVSGVRYLRDPDGVMAHGVVTVDTLVEVTI